MAPFFDLQIGGRIGAPERIRTSTVSRPHGPEPCVYANFTTGAPSKKNGKHRISEGKIHRLHAFVNMRISFFLDDLTVF